MALTRYWNLIPEPNAPPQTYSTETEENIRKQIQTSEKWTRLVMTTPGYITEFDFWASSSQEEAEYCMSIWWAGDSFSLHLEKIAYCDKKLLGGF